MLHEWPWSKRLFGKERKSFTAARFLSLTSEVSLCYRTSVADRRGVEWTLEVGGKAIRAENRSGNCLWWEWNSGFPAYFSEMLIFLSFWTVELVLFSFVFSQLRNQLCIFIFIELKWKTFIFGPCLHDNRKQSWLKIVWLRLHGNGKTRLFWNAAAGNEPVSVKTPRSQSRFHWNFIVLAFTSYNKWKKKAKSMYFHLKRCNCNQKAFWGHWATPCAAAASRWINKEINEIWQNQ